MEPEQRSRERLFLLVVVVLAAVLRLSGIGDQNLWCDEVYSLELSTYSVPVIFGFEDGHPPLYHLLQKAACAIVDGEACGRVLSALIGIATVAIAYGMAGRFFDTGVARMTALVLAISPFHVWYSREGRMYALVVAFSVLASAFVPGIVAQRRASVFAYGLASLGGLLSHYAYACVIAAQVACLVGATWRRELLRRLATASVTLIALGFVCAAALPAFREVLLGPLGPAREAELLATAYAAFSFLAGFGVGPSVAELHMDRSYAALWPHASEILLVTAVGVLTTLSGLRALLAEKRWRIYVLGWLAIPFAALAAASVVTGLGFNPRYVMGAFPAFVLLVALGMARASRLTRALSIAGLVVIATLSIARDRFDPKYGREQIREAVRYIEAEAGANDRILYGPDYVGPTVLHYLNDDSRAELWSEWKVGSMEHAEWLIDQARPVDGTVWILRTREWDEDPNGFLVRAVAAAFPNADLREFAGVRVYRLDPAP